MADLQIVDADVQCTEATAAATTATGAQRGAGISFTNLSYSVTVGRCCKSSEEKLILDRVSGVFQPGELVAILGPSGSGKTTLLNLLGGRAGNGRGQTLEGEIRIGARAVDPTKLRSRIAYVLQDDALWETSTVRETLSFSARMRLSGRTEQEADVEVEQLLRDLRLTQCADTMIGGPLIRGVSGGERKRTAVGVELIAQPNLLLLDEPTSGLDSFAAYILVERLQSIAHTRGITVVLTVHQPSSELFALFDSTLFLRSGEVVYRGPPHGIASYAEAIGKPLPAATNPADHVLFVAQTADSPTAHMMVRSCPPVVKDTSALMAELPPIRRRNIFVQFGALTLRRIKHTYRGVGSLVVGWIVAVIMSIIVASLFVHALDDADEVHGAGYRPGSAPGGSPGTSSGAAPTIPAAPVAGAVTVTPPAGPAGRAAGVAGVVDSVARVASRLGARAAARYAHITAGTVTPTAAGGGSPSDQAGTTPTVTMTHHDAGSGGTVGLSAGFNALIQVAIGSMFGMAQPVVLTFPMERPVFMRELNAGMYWSGVYFLARMGTEIPLAVLQAALGLLIPYFVIGFEASFFKLWGTVTLLGVGSASIALLMGCATSSPKKAAEMMPLIFVPQLFFSGIFIPISRIPVGLRWLQYVCPLKYAANLMASAEFPADSPVLEVQDIDPSKWWVYVLIMVAIIVVFRFAAAVLLSARSQSAV